MIKIIRQEERKMYKRKLAKWSYNGKLPDTNMQKKCK